MATPKYLEQTLQICSNALMQPQFLTPRQKRTFRRFIQDVQAGNEITDKHIGKVIRQALKLQMSLTHKVGGPV